MARKGSREGTESAGGAGHQRSLDGAEEAGGTGVGESIRDAGRPGGQGGIGGAGQVIDQGSNEMTTDGGDLGAASGPNAQPKLLLVDGHSLANRAFYALPPLSTNMGVPTGAVFGFLTMLFRFMQEKKPTHVAIAFDHPSPTFRHADYSEYKATRKPSPPEFTAQLPVLKEVLNTLNLQVVELAGFEADDIIGTLCTQAQEQGFSVGILSGDKDCLQLVSRCTRAILPIRGITKVKEYDLDFVLSDLGLTPSQVIDYKALAGDSSDNIPGVKGIGPKTALSLLGKFQSLDGIYERLQNVTPARVQRLLTESRDIAFLSRSLATIKTDVPLPVGPADLVWPGPDISRAKSKFNELELYSLAQRLESLKPHTDGVHSKGDSASAVDERPQAGASLFAEQTEASSTDAKTPRVGRPSAVTPDSTAPGTAAQGMADTFADEVSSAVADDKTHTGEMTAGQVFQQGTAASHGVGSSTPGAEVSEEAGYQRTLALQMIDTEDELSQLAQAVQAAGGLAIYADVVEITRDFRWPSLIGMAIPIRTPGHDGQKHRAANECVGEVPLTQGTQETGRGQPVEGTEEMQGEQGAQGSAEIQGTRESLSALGTQGAPETSEDPADYVIHSFILKEPAINPEAWQDALWTHIGPLLVDPKVTKIGFDLKWLFTLCFKRGVQPSGEFFDTLVASYLLDPTRSAYRVPEIARKYTQLEVPFIPLKAEREADPDAAGKTIEAHYGIGAASCLEATAGLKRDLRQEGLEDLANAAEFPLIEVLAAMEAAGVGVDFQLGQSIRKEFASALQLLEDSVYGIAGEEFNLGSPKQLSHVLFDKLGLKPIKKTKTGFSTDAEVLETLSLKHELPEKILEYRQYAKLKSTYLDILEDVINPTTGRVHSTFHQTVTATGRLSSSEPNLQNIPVRGELGRSLRRIFIPARGRLFLAADYSQIELRIMAHMADDPSMIHAFVNGEDIHTKTASEMFGVPVDQVDGDLRAKAKAVNFGVIYGISDFGLARNTRVSRDEARHFIETYFARYPMVKQFMDASVESTRKSGCAVTILGRKRPIPDINSRIRQKRMFAERTAINTPIQGSAADIIKLAMVRIYRRLKDEGLISRMILQVHDELIFEVPPSEESLMRELVIQEMEGVMDLKVPLKVDLDVGKSWYDV